MTTNQLKMFNQCVEAIDAGRSIILTGRSRVRIMAALREHYAIKLPAMPEIKFTEDQKKRIYEGCDPRKWMPEIEDETLPPGYRYWSQEAKDRYNKQRAEVIKQFMKPITDKIPKTGFPLIITSCDSDTDRFKDLFTKAV